MFLTEWVSEQTLLSPWELGTQDCYSLVREVYQTAAEISLGDYPRNPDVLKSAAQYTKYYAAEGFRSIPLDEALQPLDVLVFSLRLRQNSDGSYISDHAGVLCTPESNVFLHRRYQLLPEQTVLSNYWRNRLKYVYRRLDDGYTVEGISAG